MEESKFQTAVRLARAGQRAEARGLFQQILSADRSNELAWLWYAECAETPTERVTVLEMCLRINPGAQRARAGLLALRHVSEFAGDLGRTQPVFIGELDDRPTVFERSDPAAEIPLSPPPPPAFPPPPVDPPAVSPGSGFVPLTGQPVAIAEPVAPAAVEPTASVGAASVSAASVGAESVAAAAEPAAQHAAARSAALPAKTNPRKTDPSRRAAVIFTAITILGLLLIVIALTLRGV